MRAAPAFQVSVRRFGVWRSAVSTLSASGLLVVAVWLTTRDVPLTSATSLLAALASLLAVAFGASLAKSPHAQLRWDGRAWHLGDATGEPLSGDLSVAIDLGPWMLLRFRFDLSGRIAWLPVQRRGLEPTWHALRCSVYSPRPAPVDDSPAGF